MLIEHNASKKQYDANNNMNSFSSHLPAFNFFDFVSHTTPPYQQNIFKKSGKINYKLGFIGMIEKLV